MARVLAYQAPATGHVLPCTGILVELARRGHEVHVRTRGDDVALLTSLGLAAAPIDPRIEAVETDDWKARSQSGALQRLAVMMAERGIHEVSDLQRAIAEVEPDLLVVDVTCEGASYAAEASGLPWVQYCPYPPIFPSSDAPPYGMGLRPARGRVGALRDDVLRALGPRLTARYVPPLNALRSDLGLPPLERFDEQHLKPDRFLLLTAEPYEYPRTDWPESVRLVGPVLWEPPAEPPSWLADETRPIVLVTASTLEQGDHELIATTLEALADEDVAVVATTAAQDPARFDPPPNARIERYLPHTPIIARAVCVVSHGGQGITQKALAAGVPVCAVPFCRDQFDVARRVEVAEAGVRLHHRRLSPARLRAAVQRATAMRPGAEAVAEAFAAAGGAPAAADAVEELVESPASLGG
jgi:MGT family glycosyltransferase